MGLVAILELQVFFPYLVQWWNSMALKPITQIISFVSLSSLWLSVTALPENGRYLIAKRGKAHEGRCGLQLTDATAIPEAVYNNIVLYEQYAAAAYCNVNSNSPHTTLQCSDNGADNCPLVQAADTYTISEFQEYVRLRTEWRAEPNADMRCSSTYADATGYVAYDVTRKTTVVAFRGSRSFRNFVADLEYNMNSTDLCHGCDAHGGFWQAWLESRTGILSAVQAAKEQNPNYKLVVTGHSFGGALATLCAAELRKMGHDTALYTYGSPRVGNKALADFVTNQPGGNFRITHTNDPVPHLPLLMMGFQHVRPEYYISTGNEATAGLEALTKFDGAQDWGGNTGHLMTSIESHLWYFNSVTACGEGIEF